jgi:hypothetical protein
VRRAARGRGRWRARHRTGRRAIERVARDASAFGLQRQAPFNFLVDAGWSDPGGDRGNIAWAKELATAMKRFAVG